MIININPLKQTNINFTAVNNNGLKIRVLNEKRK